MEDCAPLGRVEEVFGPVMKPLYAFRYAGSGGPCLDMILCAQSYRSVLCMEDRAPLGRVEEVFGPVMKPLYAFRYAGSGGAMPETVCAGAAVYSVTRLSNFLEAEVLVRDLKGNVEYEWDMDRVLNRPQRHSTGTVVQDVIIGPSVHPAAAHLHAPAWSWATDARALALVQCVLTAKHCIIPMCVVLTVFYTLHSAAFTCCGRNTAMIRCLCILHDQRPPDILESRHVTQHNMPPDMICLLTHCSKFRTAAPGVLPPGLRPAAATTKPRPRMRSPTSAMTRRRRSTCAW